eukprot:14435-Amphidinium_carterae.2
MACESGTFLLVLEDIEFAQPGKQKLFHQPRPPICESSRIGALATYTPGVSETALAQAVGSVGGC